MPIATKRQLLEAGVHFGHQTRRWNPKMKPFIFGERNGIYIIDLEKTLALLEEAYEAVKDISGKGGNILFVGTKKQCQEAVEKYATHCGMPYVSLRWLGGTLTNFQTIKLRIDRLQQLIEMEDQQMYETLPKKEVLRLNHEREKLVRNLHGITEMAGLPDALFVVDTKKEQIAVAEANRLGIPIIAVVDTNCDPDEVTHPIPGNDDAIRAASLMCQVIADAVLDGKAMRPSQVFEPDEPDGGPDLELEEILDAAAGVTTKEAEQPPAAPEAEPEAKPEADTGTTEQASDVSEEAKTSG